MISARDRLLAARDFYRNFGELLAQCLELEHGVHVGRDGMLWQASGWYVRDVNKNSHGARCPSPIMPGHIGPETVRMTRVDDQRRMNS